MPGGEIVTTHQMTHTVTLPSKQHYQKQQDV